MFLTITLCTVASVIPIMTIIDDYKWRKSQEEFAATMARAQESLNKHNELMRRLKEYQ